MENKSSNDKTTEDDLPDDFFDDFNNAEFIDGLSILDTWNGNKPRALEDDLRDLIRSRKEESARESDKNTSLRRDINKTNRDIKKDKEAKVKEHISKYLDDAAGPPGTELDDFDFETKTKQLKSHSPVRKRRSPSPVRKRRSPSPVRKRRSPSPVRKRRSPERKQSSPRRNPARDLSPLLRLSPGRRSPRPFRRRSPVQFNPYHWNREINHRKSNSPSRRYNRHHSPLLRHHSPNHYKSGVQRRPRRRSKSRSRSRERSSKYRPSRSSPAEKFSASNVEDYYPPPPDITQPMNMMPHPQMMGVPAPQTSYYPTQNYDYGAPMVAPTTFYSQPAPQMAPQMVPPPLPVPAPDVMPPVMQEPRIQPASVQDSITSRSEDPLDKLLEEGKISREDYMKLKPKNRDPVVTFGTLGKVNTLTRCNDAASKLGKLHLPNRVLLTRSKSPQQKAETTFSSPLRKDAAASFNFTSTSSSTKLQPNKQLLDSIASSIHQETTLKSPSKDSKYRDSSTQTTTAFCETCEIRQLTHNNEKSTWVDSEHFTSSVHTQVVEEELAKSKTTFTPFGTKGDSANISLSHLTPAQLIVSQLAAKAKKLERPGNAQENSGHYSTDSNQFYPGNYGYRDTYRY